MYGNIYVDRAGLERQDDCIIISIRWLADEGQTRLRLKRLPDLEIKDKHPVRLGITNLSKTGGEIERQGERYVDAIRSGEEDVQVIELKHKESMEKSSGVAKRMNARQGFSFPVEFTKSSQRRQHKKEYWCVCCVSGCSRLTYAPCMPQEFKQLQIAFMKVVETSNGSPFLDQRGS